MSVSRTPARQLGFSRAQIHRNAVKVVSSLQQAGYDGYLVGGCVRDLILGQRPKDFDITTNATPEQICRLFSRARIIGRRFKLVHVRFGREVYEVATYRADPGSAKKTGIKKWLPWGGAKTRLGRIADDNVFGCIEEDAVRRDFTVNALYYDPHTEEVLDFVDGLGDAQRRQLKVIGVPRRRFAEDPVRMLRVLRFQEKLQLQLEPGLIEAIDACAELIDEVPAARLFDEVLKLFHHAHAAASWRWLQQRGLSGRLFPQLSAFVEADHDPLHTQRLVLLGLENTDRRVQQGKPVIASFLFCVLLWSPFQQTLATLRDKKQPVGQAVWQAADIVFARQSTRVAVPRRVSVPAIEIWQMQSLLERRAPRSIQRTLENRRFRAAYDFLLLRAEVGQVPAETAAWWTRLQQLDASERDRLINDLKQPQSATRQRRRNAPGYRAAKAVGLST